MHPPTLYTLCTAGSIHKAVLTGLSPDTTYFYQVIDAGATPGDPSTSSAVLTFTTPPAPGADTTFIWLMAADIGHSEADMSSTTVAIKPGALGVSWGIMAPGPRPRWKLQLGLWQSRGL